jgi:phytoene/squalene synthetase
VFGPLAHSIAQYGLPENLLADLLSAFMQDIEKTRDNGTYADRAELLDYCRRSANPVGRLLLHLYGVHDARR